MIGQHASHLMTTRMNTIRNMSINTNQRNHPNLQKTLQNILIHPIPIKNINIRATIKNITHMKEDTGTTTMRDIEAGGEEGDGEVASEEEEEAAIGISTHETN